MLSQICVQTSGNHVHNASKAVLCLCNLFARLTQKNMNMGTSTDLYAALYESYTQNYPLQKSVHNREFSRLIPTIHSPNNKNYLGKLDLNYRNTVEKEIRI
jgi:hypothetical protein